MPRKYRCYTPEKRAEVAIEALREECTAQQIAHKYDVSPRVVLSWRDQLLSTAPKLFESKTSSKAKQEELEKEQLLQKIGQLTVENDYLKKKLKR